MKSFTCPKYIFSKIKCLILNISLSEMFPVLSDILALSNKFLLTLLLMQHEIPYKEKVFKKVFHFDNHQNCLTKMTV